jgi:hypothetical protein
MNTFIVAIHNADPYLPPGIDDRWCEQYGAIDKPIPLEEFINDTQDDR